MAGKQRAVWVEDQTFKLTTVDIPRPAKGEVLIKNVAVASNPKDWKIPTWSENYKNVEGNDIAGHIEEVGEGVTKFRKGDKVAAFTKMRSDAKYGAYAEYTVGLDSCTFKLGDKTTFEDAATLPLAVMTAVFALYDKLELPEQAPADHPPIIVNGGATSVGSFAVQLLKRSGYRVVTTAGSALQVPRDLGADEVVDYRGKSDEELSAALKKAAPGARHALDAVHNDTSIVIMANALSEGGTVTCVLFKIPDNVPNGVKVVQTRVGEAYEKRPDFASKWYDRLGQWLEDGSFKGESNRYSLNDGGFTRTTANKVKLMPKGLASVPDGIELLRNNKVSGEKLVYRIADTPKE